MQIDLFVALLDEQQEAKSNLREFTQNLVKRGIAEAIEENDEAGALYILLETVVDEIAEYWGVAVDIRPLNYPYFMRINKNLVVNNKGEVFNASFDSYLVDAWTWTGERNIQCERTEITLAEKVGYIELKGELSLELVENIAAQIVEFAANEGSKEEVKPEPEPELANWGDVQQPLVINNLAKIFFRIESGNAEDALNHLQARVKFLGKVWFPEEDIEASEAAFTAAIKYKKLYPVHNSFLCPKKTTLLINFENGYMLQFPIHHTVHNKVFINLADKYKDNHVLIKNNLAKEAPLFIQSIIIQEAEKHNIGVRYE